MEWNADLYDRRGHTFCATLPRKPTVEQNLKPAYELLTHGKCRICGQGCIWIPMVDGELYTEQVCSDECLEKAKAKEGPFCGEKYPDKEGEKNEST